MITSNVEKKFKKLVIVYTSIQLNRKYIKRKAMIVMINIVLMYNK